MTTEKRYFNTSGQNILTEHYTLLRENLVAKGKDLVHHNRYFTIWAPRQTGKSTYFLLLKTALEKEGYAVIHLNVENYLDATKTLIVEILVSEVNEALNDTIKAKNFSEVERQIKGIKDNKLVLIIDEIEGLNPRILGQFLHALRNLYHFRYEHCLKSVILVGVSNIVGVVEDNASPFNISDNLNVPYFTKEETFELLGQHEKETGQLFDPEVKAKIAHVTANQPGLVNGFAQQLIERNADKPVIGIEEYLEVEDWYLRRTIDKNITNILNKARRYRKFVERLLFWGRVSAV